MATDEGLVPGGIYQDAHGDVYMRDPCGSNLWLHPGEERAFRDSEVARPLTHYVPAPSASAPAKGKADTRVFRITRQFEDPEQAAWPRYGRQRKEAAKIEYGDRRVVSAKCGSGGYSHRYGPVVKVEATNADATEGWTDVTSEFLEA